MSPKPCKLIANLSKSVFSFISVTDLPDITFAVD